MIDPSMLQQMPQFGMPQTPMPGQNPDLRRQMMGRLLAQHAQQPQGSSPLAGISQVAQGALGGYLMRPQAMNLGQGGLGLAQGMGGVGMSQFPMFGGQ